MITPSECIDEVWHCHILHTKDYQEFARVCGRMLHHLPGMPNEKEKFNTHYDRTHTMYLEVFRESPPEIYWPRKVPLSQEIGRGSIRKAFETYLKKMALTPFEAKKAA